MNTQTELVDKIIENLNPDIISLVGIDKIDQYQFIPLKLKDNFLFIIINSETDKDFVAYYVNNILPYKIKYIEISNVAFLEIINYIFVNEAKFTVQTSVSKIIEQEQNGNINSYDYNGCLKRLDYGIIIFLCETLLYSIWLSKHTITLSILIWFYFSMCAIIKRLNDIKLSRWVAILAFIPVIRNVFEICLLFIPKICNYNKENINIFDPRGYLHRISYFIVIFCNIMVNSMFEYVPFFKNWIENDPRIEIVLAIFVFLVYIYICAVIKRLNAINASRWLAIFTLIPIINVAFVIYLLFAPSRCKK